MISMTWPQYKRHECRISGEYIIPLSPMETELLSTLLVLYPRPATIGELIEAAYPNPDIEPDWAEDIVGGGMRSLARKLGTFRFRIEDRYIGFRLLQEPDLRRAN